MKRSIERVLSTIGAATVLVVGLNAISYAATGTTFLLGGTNTAKKVTTIKNSGPGAVLNLQAKSSAYAPFTTNGKGLVGNLNSQFLNGKSLAQVQAGATKLNGLTASDIEAAANPPLLTFNRTDADTVSYKVDIGMTVPAVASNPVATPGTYALTGSVTYACGPTATAGYTIRVYTWDGTHVPTLFGENSSLSATDCAKPIAIPPTTVALTSGLQLMLMVYGTRPPSPGPDSIPTKLTFAISGVLVKSDL
jgi:hypothetical protein